MEIGLRQVKRSRRPKHMKAPQQNMVKLLCNMDKMLYHEMNNFINHLYTLSVHTNHTRHDYFLITL